MSLDVGKHYVILTAILGARAVLPTPTRTNYTFKGWYTNAELTGTAVTQIDKGSYGNKTYYAKWEVNVVNVNFSGISFSKSGNVSAASGGSGTLTYGIADGSAGWTSVSSTKIVDVTNYNKLVITGLYNEGGSVSQGIVTITNNTTGAQLSHKVYDAARGTDLSLAQTVDISGVTSLKIYTQLYVSGQGSWQDWAQMLIYSCQLTG